MKIIAHRCGTDKFPELTIDSAKHSLSHGARLVEMDVHKTGKELWIMACENGNLGYTNPENIAVWKKMGVDAILVNDVCIYLS